MCVCCEIPKVPKAARVLTWPLYPIWPSDTIGIDFTWGPLEAEAIRNNQNELAEGLR